MDTTGFLFAIRFVHPFSPVLTPTFLAHIPLWPVSYPWNHLDQSYVRSARSALDIESGRFLPPCFLVGGAMGFRVLIFLVFFIFTLDLRRITVLIYALAPTMNPAIKRPKTSIPITIATISSTIYHPLIQAHNLRIAASLNFLVSESDVDCHIYILP